MAGMDDLGQGFSARYDNGGNRAENLYDKGGTASNSFVLSEEFGDKRDSQDYENTQCGTAPGYVDIGDQYGDESTAVPTGGDGEETGINDQMQGGTMLYDYSQDYCGGSQFATTECYYTGGMDAYPSPLTGKDNTGSLRSMSGGISGGGMVGPPSSGISNPDDTVDNVNSSYWYGCQMTPPPYGTPPPSSGATYPRSVNRYGSYRYGGSSPYYPVNNAVYMSYPVERNAPYPANYNVSNETFYNSKQAYAPYTPRRGIGSSIMPSSAKTGPMSSQHLPMDQMQYKGWYGQMANLEANALQAGSIYHPAQHDLRGAQRPTRINSEVLYSELTSRLQRELTNKRHVSSGRPKMNRHNYVCAMCNAKTTPQWRYIKGTSVCNACYMRIRKQKMRQQQQQEEEIARSECASADTEVPDDGRTEETTPPDRAN
ncbi:GATA zinc finger domain-containing protein [Babesia ovis]|uniref:GATA zinc finger domain-containing protein n=1 Tax=Babesia ovis TaxID=5869 RepID=A0A9W5WUL4_BABOV|nr:GATA zinc finger domain-containing protein [Babesia ovis]